MRLRFLDIFFHAFLRASFQYWKQIYALRMESVIISLSFFFLFSFREFCFVFFLLKYASEIVFFFVCFFDPCTILTSIFGYDLAKTSLLSLISRMHWDQLQPKQQAYAFTWSRPQLELGAPSASQCSLSIKIHLFQQKKCIETIYKSPHFFAKKIGIWRALHSCPICMMRPVTHSHMAYAIYRAADYFSSYFSINNDRHV